VSVAGSMRSASSHRPRPARSAANGVREAEATRTPGEPVMPAELRIAR
jgi:hypothetical protein